MRVVGGSLRSRIIKNCNLETTRETQDRVREAIFNVIGPYFEDKSCLDLFCGSGAMAIEAYSRGMNKIYLNDLNKDAIKVARENLSNLGIKNYIIYNLDYRRLLASLNTEFDYIFVDPPYKMDNVKEILTELYNSQTTKNGTIVIFEMAGDTLEEEIISVNLYKVKKYGKKKVCYYEVVK